MTALQQQQQQQQWADGIGISDGASKSDGYRDVDKESASPPSPKVHAGFKKAYNSVKETLAAVVGSAIDGKPEVSRTDAWIYLGGGEKMVFGN